jgi:hypothetical protein
MSFRMKAKVKQARSFLLGLLLNSEDGVNTVLQNVVKHLPDH